MASSQDIVHAYRHIYRGLLRTVQYSKPARYTARDQLRDAFRKGDPLTYDQKKIDNTIEFLRLATKEAGLEHRIVKNLLHTNWHRRDALKSPPKRKIFPVEEFILKTKYVHYDMTVAMLNQTMGLCLR